MERTQIYLIREQKKALKDIAVKKRAPLAEVVRDAVEQYIVQQKPTTAEKKMSRARGSGRTEKILMQLPMNES